MSLQSTITSEVEGRKLSTVICCCLFYGGRRCLSFLLFSVFMTTMILINTQAQEVNTSKALGHCSCGVFAGTSRDLIYTVFLCSQRSPKRSFSKQTIPINRSSPYKYSDKNPITSRNPRKLQSSIHTRIQFLKYLRKLNFRAGPKPTGSGSASETFFGLGSQRTQLLGGLDSCGGQG